MELKQIVLKCNANIFGYQLKKGGTLKIKSAAQEPKSPVDERCHLKYYEGDSFETRTYEENLTSSFSTKFDRTPEDFIKEAERINALFDEIQKENGTLPLYSFDVINKNKESNKKVTLFGMNQYLLSKNFGSDEDVVIRPFKEDISYLQYLQHSASCPFIIDLIHLECSNASQITQIIHYTTRDANGQLLQIPIITQSYFSATQERNDELMVYHKSAIDGNSYLQFDLLPDTILKVKVYGKSSRFDYESFNILNSLLSCQIQQGIDYVSLINIKKFIGESYYNDFYPDAIEKQLTSLFEKGYIDFKDGGYGYKFKILKVDGTLKKELSLTQVLKHSEYNIN